MENIENRRKKGDVAGYSTVLTRFLIKPLFPKNSNHTESLQFSFNHKEEWHLSRTKPTINYLYTFNLTVPDFSQ